MHLSIPDYPGTSMFGKGTLTGVDANGISNTGTLINVGADDNGIAECTWSPDNEILFQTVEASLLDDFREPSRDPNILQCNNAF